MEIIMDFYSNLFLIISTFMVVVGVQSSHPWGPVNGQQPQPGPSGGYGVPPSIPPTHQQQYPMFQSGYSPFVPQPMAYHMPPQDFTPATDSHKASVNDSNFNALVDAMVSDRQFLAQMTSLDDIIRTNVVSWFTTDIGGAEPVELCQQQSQMYIAGIFTSAIELAKFRLAQIAYHAENTNSAGSAQVPLPQDFSQPPPQQFQPGFTGQQEPVYTPQQ